MARETIAVDVDEVIFPMVSDLITYLDREHSVTISQSDFIKYNLEDIWKGDPKEAAALFESYKDQTGIEVAPVNGASDAIGKLSLKYDVIVMTSRDKAVENITKEWLDHHFPELFKEVHLLGNRKDSVAYRDKADVCRQLGVYCLIDDSLKPVLQTHKAGIKTILFGDYPWNQIDELPEGIIRCKDWPAVLEQFSD